MVVHSLLLSCSKELLGEVPAGIGVWEKNLAEVTAVLCCVILSVVR